MRDEIIRLLAEKEMTVTELSKVLGVSKATISYHIEELKRAGLVKVAREEIVRNFVRRYYSLAIPNANVGERIINSIKLSVNKNDRAEVFRNTVRLLGFVLLKTSPSLFKRVGFEVGRSLSQSNASIEELAELWEKLGLGKTSCTRKSLTVEECYFCSGLPNVGYTYCKFDEGFIAGFLSPKGRYKVEEVRCWGLGDELCEFKIKKI